MTTWTLKNEPEWIYNLISMDAYNGFVPVELKMTDETEFKRLVSVSLNELNMETFDRIRLIDQSYWSDFAIDCVIKALYCQSGYNVGSEMLKYSASFVKIDKLGDYLQQYMTPLEQGLEDVKIQQKFVAEEAKNYLTRVGLNYRGNITVAEFVSNWAK